MTNNKGLPAGGYEETDKGELVIGTPAENKAAGAERDEKPNDPKAKDAQGG